jgi:septal ring factor EnvC (AmiA/AmiB activator)
MKKERIIMLISSVFVLTALTMTGFYVKEKNEADKDGYVVDMSALEKKTEEKTKEIAESVEQNQANDAVKGNDLDYDPNFQEASSGDVTNTWDNQKDEEADLPEDETANKDIAEENVSEDDKTETEETKPADGENQQSEAVETASMEAAKALSFQEKDNLGWPVAGNVLINYSMDKTVYFPTLQQYKYSPAIVIAATEGENITSSADGKVLSVFEDAEIGQAVTVDIGNGYELTYGQLEDIMVLQGDIISSGDVIGKVAAPTKYYSVEGPNVYFRLTKDGRPVNPLSNLE